MSRQSFQLQPFSTAEALSAVELTGELSCHSKHLSIYYRLRDPQRVVAIPRGSSLPARQDNLWTTTCLECFFGPISSEMYWEVNLSPAGHWNIYRFDDYRSGMREESAIQSLSFEVCQLEDGLSLQLELDLSFFGVAEDGVEVAIAVVLESNQHQLSYWALTHPGQEPDFHRRDSFLLKI